MTLRPALLALLALPLVALAAPAPAQTASCSSHAEMVRRLAEGWGESRRSIGLGADNAVVEVFASAETGTWTITVTAPGGPTCLVASGESFETVADALPPEGEAA